MSGQSLSSIITRWAEDAVEAAMRGEVYEENLRALFGPQFEPALAWTQARESYAALLERLREEDSPLVLKLIVPLTPREGLELVPPEDAQIESEVDHQAPPSLVVHRPLVQREWDSVEEYRRPFATQAFVDDDGVPVAEALYIAFRTRWELEDGSEYRRQLLFERVQT